jgi:hypothetical protein
MKTWLGKPSLLEKSLSFLIFHKHQRKVKMCWIVVVGRLIASKFDITVFMLFEFAATMSVLRC